MNKGVLDGRKPRMFPLVLINVKLYYVRSKASWITNERKTLCILIKWIFLVGYYIIEI